ncbi:hypothetical protein ACHOLT_11400 [Desulfitobacterium sp. Sab5]|uniref:hypothetical protein n=1 Tax=Desulfitobacterium nosdiversum TaxID=3375356 RepID=UPI003CEB33A8
MPLFFNPEDGEIWEQLQKLPPEKRTETVKQALHEFFQSHSEFQAENINFPLPNPAVTELSLHSETERAEESSTLNCEELASNAEEHLFLEAVSENELSLESLFEASPQAIKPDPLKNLLSVIGEEDDEDVVRLLLSDQKCTEFKNETELKETELKKPEQHIEHIEMPLRTETIIPNGGLAYLLHNVIGEEEDEEVLQFFNNIAEKKEE